jgi:hypothetical protein
MIALNEPHIFLIALGKVFVFSNLKFGNDVSLGRTAPFHPWSDCDLKKSGLFLLVANNSRLFIQFFCNPSIPPGNPDFFLLIAKNSRFFLHFFVTPLYPQEIRTFSYLLPKIPDFFFTFFVTLLYPQEIRTFSYLLPKIPDFFFSFLVPLYTPRKSGLFPTCR